jgi:ABC-2 type transport system ATP-binding protein
VFFSTHITSDLEKCADDIVYISGGQIVSSLPKKTFTDRFSKDDESLEETILRMERGMENA